MSEELIERLKQRIKIRREMSGGRIDANTKDMQESIAAIEAITAERDALANRVYQLEQKNSGAAEIIAAMQETHAEDQAELKALREREPVAWFSYSADAGFSEFKTFQEAINSSRDELNEYRNEAVHDGEWPEDVAFIKFGAILGRTTELKGETDSEGWVDFQLTQSVPAREMTDEAIENLHMQVYKGPSIAPARMLSFARAIERHLKGEGE